MRTRQKCVATDTWRSLGCRTTPLEHWSRRKPTVEPRWAKQQTKKLRPKPTKINSFIFVLEVKISFYLCLIHPTSIIFSETTRPIKIKFHLDLPWDGERNNVQMILITRPRWPPCPYTTVKTFYNKTNSYIIVKTLNIFFFGTDRSMSL